MTTVQPAKPSSPQPAPRPNRPFKLIGELMNNSFARAGRAFANRDVGLPAAWPDGKSNSARTT